MTPTYNCSTIRWMPGAFVPDKSEPYAAIVPKVELTGPDGVTPIPCGVPDCYVCTKRIPERKADL